MNNAGLIFPILEIGCTLITIAILWRHPKNSPPRGLNTINVSDTNTFAQIAFFPLFIFNIVDVLVQYSSLASILTTDTAWLVVPFVLAICLFIAFIYWPIHMSLSNPNSYLGRIVGIFLIVLQMTDSIYGMITKLDYVPARLVTFYIPFYFYSLASISWLIYPPMWNKIFSIFERKNRKIFMALNLSAVALFILTGVFINLMIDLNTKLNNLSTLIEVNLAEHIVAFLIIGIFAPITAYIGMMTANYFSFRAVISDEIVIKNPDLINFESARFSFVGVFVGYQIVSFTAISWGIWLIISAIYVINLMNLLGFACKQIFLMGILPVLVLLFLNEIFRTAIGLWIYGSRYRPYPRRLSINPKRTEFNVYWEHFEYFTVFYSVLLGFIKSIGNGSKQTLYSTILWSTTPVKDGERIIDIGFMKSTEHLLGK
jgi:hypothetical protein